MIDKEKQILKDFEEGKFVSLGKDEVDRYKDYAQPMMKKPRRVTIRLSEYDFMGIQAKALEEGIPYQILISSLIHKFVTDRGEFVK